MVLDRNTWNRKIVSNLFILQDAMAHLSSKLRKSEDNTDI